MELASWVASSRLSWLVAHIHIFRLYMKGNFDVYVLWPLEKMVQNWIVDWSTSRNFFHKFQNEACDCEVQTFRVRIFTSMPCSNQLFICLVFKHCAFFNVVALTRPLLFASINDKIADVLLCALMLEGIQIVLVFQNYFLIALYPNTVHLVMSWLLRGHYSLLRSMPKLLVFSCVL